MRNNIKESLRRLPFPSILPPTLKSKQLKSPPPLGSDKYHPEQSKDEGYSNNSGGSDQSSEYCSRVSFPSLQERPRSVSSSEGSYSSLTPSTNNAAADEEDSQLLLEDKKLLEDKNLLDDKKLLEDQKLLEDKKVAADTRGWCIEGGISVHSGSWNQIFDEQERRGVIVLPLSKRGAEVLIHH
eukprot:jgi/Bigna1/130114/aug1.10_g4822